MTEAWQVTQIEQVARVLAILRSAFIGHPAWHGCALGDGCQERMALGHSIVTLQEGFTEGLEAYGPKLVRHRG